MTTQFPQSSSRVSQSTQISRARRRQLRAPRRASRMLGTYAPPADAPMGALPARASLRLAVPDRLLCMTRFGLECAAEGPSGWWRQVEDAMQELVEAHLPARASDVEMSLDAERLEVVLSYALPDASRLRKSMPGAHRCA